jgi:hypothetical protein
MKSILLSFSLRVACGVLRRIKSMTRAALNPHIGRLRSVLGSRHSENQTQTQVARTKQPSPGRKCGPVRTS